MTEGAAGNRAYPEEVPGTPLGREAPPAEGTPLPSIGRARRFARDDGELWQLPADAGRIAARLVELGRAGVGGFAPASGAEGPWLVRRRAPDLDAWLAAIPGPVAWRRAASLIASLAEAAHACEQASLFPGALVHAQLSVCNKANNEDNNEDTNEAIELRADSLVYAMVGAPSPELAAPRWLPPEATGRPADNASNRYAIGLVAYQLVTGEHPFAGRGLRAGFDDQADRGAPPFAAALAATLPPGLQSLCLRLLAPDPAKRFPTAAAIATAARQLVARGAPAVSDLRERAAPAPPATLAMGARPLLAHGAAVISDLRKRAEVAPLAARRAKDAPAPRARSSPPRRRGRTVLTTLVPLVAGMAIAVWAIRAAGSTGARDVTARPVRPLVAARELADCASCHPRQAAEWSRSVMAHAVESPLFGSLEMLIEEQVGRDRTCPDGAGVLRAAGADSCVDPRTRLPITGSGGAGWCVNCHAPGENLASAVPAWNAHTGDPRSRRPLRDLVPASTMEGISCAACHQMTGPAHPGARYQGNPSWISTETGARFLSRPEDQRGLFGIANSGYLIDPRALGSTGALVPGGAHRQIDAAARAYRHSSEFCGACHDVRLFGTDAVSGEHWKRLRNAYSEWAAWADDERRAGRTPASCQDCHMSLYPGVCVAAPGGATSAKTAASGGCPEGTALSARAPGSYPTGHGAAGSPAAQISTHYFSGVDVPLARAFDPAAVDDPTLDVAGIPVGARQRRDLLLASALKLAIDTPRRDGDHLEIPIVVENVGAGHRVPAGFSQEREIWVHLRVTDARGRLVYEVGRVDRGDQDLRDKQFLRVTTTAAPSDRLGRPQGLFGADVADGPDVPRWAPFGSAGAFRGRGLVNFQNGFLRCVRCIGTIDEHGQCQAAAGQETRRADRYIDGDYDADTGECRSNLHGSAALFETYFPVGALDASRGIAKGPDAIVDTRSLPPGKPARYAYDLTAPGAVAPFTVFATLEFRAFPPYLVRAFIAYEAEQARAGLRPSGPLVDQAVQDRLEVVDLATARAVIP